MRVTTEHAVDAFAPVVMQESRCGNPALDLPLGLDADGSGRLDDDFARLSASSATVAVYYAQAREDHERIYLFYAFYYAADLAFTDSPCVDHLGDLEGALVVVGKASGAVEEVVTEAHGRFYLFTARRRERLPRGYSGDVALTREGRPILFAEGGGHGIYAFADGRWSPAGGEDYPEGTARVSASRLTALLPSEEDRLPPWVIAERSVPVVVRSMDSLERFTAGTGWLRDLPRDARHPRFWFGRRLGQAWDAGAILDRPRMLLRSLASRPRP